MGKIIKLTEAELKKVIERTINEAAKTKVKKAENKVNDKKAKPFEKKVDAFGKKSKKVNESEEPVNEIFGFSKKEQFLKHFDEFINNWTSKGVVAPTPEEKQAIVLQAEKDGFGGKLGLTNPKTLKVSKFGYRPESSIKFSNPLAAGGTGDATGGTSGA